MDTSNDQGGLEHEAQDVPESVVAAAQNRQSGLQLFIPAQTLSEYMKADLEIKRNIMQMMQMWTELAVGLVKTNIERANAREEHQHALRIRQTEMEIKQAEMELKHDEEKHKAEMAREAEELKQEQARTRAEEARARLDESRAPKPVPKVGVRLGSSDH